MNQRAGVIRLVARDLVIIVACACGVLIGLSRAHPNPPAPVAHITTHDVQALARALNHATASPTLEPSTAAHVAQAEHVLHEIHRGEIVVTTTPPVVTTTPPVVTTTVPPATTTTQQPTAGTRGHPFSLPTIPNP